MDFVIIGGDAAGMSAASRAKRSKPEMNVTVLEMTNDVSYSACGLPYNIAAPEREMDDLIVRKAQVFRDKQGIDLLTGHRVEALDCDAKIVKGTTAEGGTFEKKYDKLLIATGGRSIKPDIPGIDLPGVMALKNIADGRRIKSFLIEKNVKKVVIIGMGYIALEMCEALRGRGIEVAMVKPGKQLLPWMSEELSDVVKGELEDNGVSLYPGHAIEKIEETGSGYNVVCDGLELSGDMVLVAIGIIPNSEFARDAGLELSVGNSISVDTGLRTSDSDIYAAGDCADAHHIVSGQKTWIPLALWANRGGWAVADNVTGKDVELQGIVGTAIFKVFDLEVARTGLTVADAEKAGFEPAEVMVKTRSKAHGHPGNTTIFSSMTADVKTGRLLGAQMVGREGVAHRINAVAVALHNSMTVEGFTSCDLSYAPPFGPVWDPLLTAGNQLMKKL